MSRNRNRYGFSLIELLIVVAIIAALIGVAVPYFQSNLAEAQITKARQDLDTIRNAINLYESRYRPLVGDDLKQILGQTMQDIPKDPWGGDYFLDANLGIIWTYGADGQPQGNDGDADQVFQYKPKIQVRKVLYEGPFGRPTERNTLTLIFTKPFLIGAGTGTGAIGSTGLDKIVLVKDISSGDASAISSGGNRVLFSDAALGKWSITSSEVVAAKDGRLVLKCSDKNTIATQSITPVMAVDLVDTAWKVMKINPANDILLGFGSTPSGNVTTSDPDLMEELFYKGYPGKFNEVGAVSAENGLGARIERKL